MYTFHSFAPGEGRYAEPGRSYLITTVTDHRHPYFADWRIGRSCVGELRTLHQLGIITSLAWVLMPDHLHWLMTLHHTPLDYVLRRFKSRSACAINKHLRRKGPVWQHGFQDHAVRSEQDMVAVARYIVANPLRKGLVASIGDYPLWDAAWLDGEVPDIQADERRPFAAGAGV